jgi:archaellum component FlaG (FlaF/FlaG flagellin family)
MDKAITSGLLIIASIAAAVALINAVIPAMNESSGALVTANSTAADRIRTDIEIVHVASDTSSPTEDQIILWVKNIGHNQIQSVESSDMFLTMPGTVKRLSHGSSSGAEYWDYVIENGSSWGQVVTVKMTLHLANGSVTTGAYTVSVSVYNGVSASKGFSV